MSSFSYSPAASSHFPQHSVFWHDCVQQCLYMHMCVCVESWKRGLALSITKKRGVHKDYNNVKEGGGKKGRRGEMKRKHRSSLNCLRLLAEKSIHRWAAWSKREFVQSDFILTFLAFSPPPPPTPNPPWSATACKPSHRPMRSAGLYALAIRVQWTKKKEGHRSNGDKGH